MAAQQSVAEESDTYESHMLLMNEEVRLEANLVPATPRGEQKRVRGELLLRSRKPLSEIVLHKRKIILKARQSWPFVASFEEDEALIYCRLDNHIP